MILAAMVLARGLTALLALDINGDPLAMAFFPFTEEANFLKPWLIGFGLLLLPWPELLTLTLAFSILLWAGPELDLPTEPLGLAAHLSVTFHRKPPSLRGSLCILVGPLENVFNHSGFLGGRCKVGCQVDFLVLSVPAPGVVPFLPYVLLLTTIHGP